MAYIVTPDLGLELADPATIQAFETPVVNENFLKLEAAIVATSGLIKRVADLNALAALSLTGITSGTVVEVQELRALFMRNAAGSAWQQMTPSAFATTAARDTAYAKASGAFLVTGAQSVIAGWQRTTYYTLWVTGTNPGGMRKAGWYIDAGQATGFGRDEALAFNFNSTGVAVSTTGGTNETQLCTFNNTGNDGRWAQLDMFGYSTAGANFAGYVALLSKNALDSREVARSSRVLNGGTASNIGYWGANSRVLILPGETMNYNVQPVHEGGGVAFSTPSVQVRLSAL